MNFNQYQELGIRSWNQNLSYDDQLINCALGLVGEASEVAEHIKKYLYHNKEINPSELLLELGDALYYTSRLADILGFTLEEVAQANIDKLAARWPNGFGRE